uniref:Alternative protein COMMD10 n=1 Tax=Homo sapiens TaxID=9606 RepID=L8EAU8_HUMAN|nr:alternative protein COMMD10 [Homo sapiens]
MMSIFCFGNNIGRKCKIVSSMVSVNSSLSFSVNFSFSLSLMI